MGAYDRRDEPPWVQYRAGPEYSLNRHILTWWTDAHDKLLADLIGRWQWVWSSFVLEAVKEATPGDRVERWRAKDPLCSRYSWYNVLRQFCESRADRLGLTNAIRKPQWRICPLCTERYIESSLPYALVARLGVDQLDFCAPCLKRTVLQGTGDRNATRDGVLSYVRDLAAVIGAIPPQGFGEGRDDLRDLDTESRLELLKVLDRKPTTARVKELYGSWLNTLLEAGVLPGETRRTSRGTQTFAKDGHICYSLGEKTIDDWLSARGIAHEREPRYPEGNFRADWAVGDVLIEYFGLAGDTAYDEKSEQKMFICRRHGVRLVAVYASDLASSKGIERRLGTILVPVDSSSE
jgi:hypothetical protein